jgi:HD-GYP domain-containing protein (c-di-GMP phosphodiesterase class II)
MDGSGYPDGLKGEEIPLGARILAVADSFDAMTADRAYRKALTTEEAKKELIKYSGSRYDKKVVEAMLDIISDNQKGEANG